MLRWPLMLTTEAQRRAMAKYRDRKRQEKASKPVLTPTEAYIARQDALQRRKLDMPDAGSTNWRDDMRNRVASDWAEMRLKTPLERRVLRKTGYTLNKRSVIK